MDDLLNRINARRSGTQPRPSTKAEFPWTFGHPDHPYNMNENPQAAFTEFAFRSRNAFKPPRKHDTYGICHKTMKGNLVLLASTQAYIKSPKHADLVQSLYAAAPTFDDVNLSSGADDDWSLAGENMNDDTASSPSTESRSSESPVEEFRSPTRTDGMSRLRLITRSTGGSSPLLDGLTLPDDGSDLDDDLDSHYENDALAESCSSDSEDGCFDGMWTKLDGVHSMPTLADLLHVDIDIYPYNNSYTYVPRRNKLIRKGWPIEHDDLRIDVIELTESQGTPDWFIARRFVSTSTSQIEINRAVSLIGIENLEMQENFDRIKKILHMRVSIPTAEDAPEHIKEFLLALAEGGAIDTSANEWWKLKYNDKAITGTQHINPALAHLGVKVQALCP